jgi:hypothetical protein
MATRARDGKAMNEKVRLMGRDDTVFAAAWKTRSFEEIVGLRP